MKGAEGGAWGGVGGEGGEGGEGEVGEGAGEGGGSPDAFRGPGGLHARASLRSSFL